MVVKLAEPPNEILEKIKVVAYARVSTSSRDQENSFENQHKYFLDRAEKMENEELVEIYADKGITGTSLKKRDDFLRMIYDAGIDRITVKQGHQTAYAYIIDKKRKPKFQKIYVRNTSRFARDADIIGVLRHLCNNGVYVHFLDIDLIYDNMDKEFTLNLFLNFAQQESIDKSRKVKDGNEVTAKTGTIRVGGSGLFGYDYNEVTKKLTINEEEAKIVRIIFDLTVAGYGRRRIINYLESMGAKTKSGNLIFSVSTIKKIQTNEKYYGNGIRNKYDTGTVFHKTYPKLKDDSKWIDHEGVIPSIITKDTFLEAQKILSSNVNSIEQKGIYKGLSELSGKITCSKCGLNYTRNIDRGRAFYNCSGKKSRGVNFCDGININESTINDGIEHLLKRGVKHKFEKYKIRMLEVLKDMIRDEIEKQIDKSNELEVSKLQDEVNKMNDQKNRLAELYLDGDIEKSFLDVKSAEINDKLTHLNDEIAHLSKTNEQVYSELEEFDLIMKQISSLEVEEISTREELLKLITMKVGRMPLQPNKPEIKFYYKFDDPIKRLAEKYNVINHISSVDIYFDDMNNYLTK